ncbi:MAG: 16S rRNA (cytosine(1402)-N(4))-methyltransferase RsmH [Actinomycetota bacterium]|nr:16S rRNA (cytosine(1402)-N(4))-methyltransferase RsmH [Actinomycetota bacterium]
MNDPAAPGRAFAHLPVMVAEVTELFRPVPPGPVVDATVGGGGHARALLEAHPHLEVVGLDRDADALAAAATALQPFSGRVVLRRSRFDRIAAVCEELGHEHVSGVLFDLGVSSPQLDRPERGFSYRGDGPLDMRMDREQPTTADDVVNGYGESRLAAILADLGDERYARRVARAVVAARPVATTGELAEVIRSAIPAPARRRGGDPARRSFQAIRIEVNEELVHLGGAIDDAVDLLAPAGRAVVLAYHSGEDRIVKAHLTRAATGGCTCPPRLPCVCGARPAVRHLRRGTRPGPGEITANRRSESARLRAVEKLAV